MATVSKMMVNGNEYGIIDKTARADISAAQTAITAAQNAITAETTARTAADTEIRSNIDVGRNLSGMIDLTDVEIQNGYYISSFTYGTISQNDAFMLSDYIEIPQRTGSVTVNRNIYHDGQVYPQSAMVGFYDSSKNYLGYGIISNFGSLSTVLIDPDSKYMRINFSASGVAPFVAVNSHNVNNIGSFPTPLELFPNLSCDDLPFNNVYLISSRNNSIEHKPYDDFVGLIISLSHRGGQNSGGQQIAVDHSTKAVYIRDYWGATPVWSNWRDITSGFIKSWEGTMPGDASTVSTGIYLTHNTTYLIRFPKQRTRSINVFVSGNTSNYKKIMPGEIEVVFTSGDASGTLTLYSDGSTDSVSVDVYALESYQAKADDVPRIYRVGKTASECDFTSVTECFLALKDDLRPKIIYIEGGDYDIYQEYQDADVPEYTGDNPTMDYFDYCVWVPANSHVIGRGIVRLKWLPTSSQVNWKVADTVSPLNVAGSATLENIEVYCKNGRYCIHNDSLGKTRYRGAIQRYINVRCYKYTNDYDETDSSKMLGFTHTTGFGIDARQRHEYINCEFYNESTGRAFYGHTRGGYTSENDSPDITLTDCIIETAGNVGVKLGCSKSDAIHVRTKFSGCYFNKPIQVLKESSTETDVPNNFDITMLDCGDVSVTIEDPDNPYPLELYRTTNTNG